MSGLMGATQQWCEQHLQGSEAFLHWKKVSTGSLWPSKIGFRSVNKVEEEYLNLYTQTTSR